MMLDNKILFFTVFLVLFLVPQSAAASNDLIIICKQKGFCAIQQNKTALFSETNLAPGEIRKRNIRVINQNKDLECAIRLGGVDNSESHSGSENSLIDLLLFGIDQQQFFPYADLLDLEVQPVIGSVSPKSNKTFTLQAGFNPDATNELQGKSISVDLTLTFSCEEPSATPSRTSDKKPTRSSVLGRTTNAEAADTIPCEEAEPNTQLDLINIDQEKGEISVSWTPRPNLERTILSIKEIETNLLYQSDVTNKQQHTVRGLKKMNYELMLETQTTCGDTVYSNAVSTDLSDQLSDDRGDDTGEAASASADPRILGATTEKHELLATKAFSQFEIVLTYILIGLTTISIIRYLFKKLLIQK